MKVLVLGGYGAFGGRLVHLLIEDGNEVIVAGRSLDAARTFTEKHGGRPLACNTADRENLAAMLEATRPGCVVDAAGPFQAYAGYSTARAAIAARAHNLDLSDDATFTAGIGILDAEARAAGSVVLSGVSSVPALSSAAVSALADGLARIDLIESAILPGNLAPRGNTVMAAILGQAGAPLERGAGLVRQPQDRGLARPDTPGRPDRRARSEALPSGVPCALRPAPRGP